MEYQHENLARGQWFTLSLAEQLGNVGSEISRARNWQGKDKKLFEGAVFRGLELLDLTLADPRWQRARRLKEIARARELVCDAYLGGREYQTNFNDLMRYFDAFAVVARASFLSSL
ncbi:hypothetical protein HY628_00185 [Candidatus Uhrbacteria bacterium]|nr:hypothetical protein [Candidatus Uhrbacteria bacterium]